MNLLEGFFEKLPVPFRWDTFGKLWEKNATSIEKIRTSSIESESTAEPMSSTFQSILPAKEEGHDYKQLLMVCDITSGWCLNVQPWFFESLVWIWIYYISDVEDGLRPMVKPPHVNLTCRVCIVPVKTELLAAGRGLRSDGSVESFEECLIVNY